MRTVSMLLLEPISSFAIRMATPCQQVRFTCDNANQPISLQTRFRFEGPAGSSFYSGSNSQMSYPTNQNQNQNQMLPNKDVYNSPSNAYNTQYGFNSNAMPNSNTYGGSMGGGSSNTYSGSMGANSNALPNSNTYGGSMGNILPNSNTYGGSMGNVLPNSNTYGGSMGVNSNPNANSWQNSNTNNRFNTNAGNTWNPNRDNTNSNYGYSNQNTGFYNHSCHLTRSSVLVFLSLIVGVLFAW